MVRRFPSTACLFLVLAGLGGAVPAGGVESPAPQAAQLAGWLLDVCQVGPAGQNHTRAVAAVRQLEQQKLSAVMSILRAFDEAGPLSINWLRGSIESIVQRETARGEQLSSPDLEAYLREAGHHPRGRRFAFELLTRADPQARQRWLPQLLNDSSTELRGEAVQTVIDQAEEALAQRQQDAAREKFRVAMTAARDPQQIEKIVKRLKEVGETVDLPRHFGFIMQWKVIGPFDNTGRKGFEMAYSPENSVNFTTASAGKGGRTLRWIDVSTTDPYGVVDLNRALEHTKEVVAYAASEFVSPQSREVDLRLGTGNAWKLWLNGELLFARGEYHRGKRVDQYRVRAKLRAGKNLLLLKLCQNEEKYSWTEDWQVQFRVCDAVGTAILSADRSPAATPAPPPTGSPR